jgi:hypothetical protein
MRKNSTDKIVVLLLLLAITACSKTGYLSATITSNLDSTTVFTDSSYSMQFLNNIYSHAGFSADPKRFAVNGVGGGLDAACDEAEGPNLTSNSGFEMFATGTVNPSIIPIDAWYTSYSMIRAVNQFLAHLNQIPFNATLKAETRSEAHFCGHGTILSWWSIMAGFRWLGIRCLLPPFRSMSRVVRSGPVSIISFRNVIWGLRIFRPRRRGPTMAGPVQAPVWR